MSATNCRLCGSPLEFEDVSISFLGRNPITRREAKPCAACAEKKGSVLAAYNDSRRRNDWLRKSGIPETARGLSLDREIWKSAGMAIDSLNVEMLEVLIQWVSGDWSLFVHGLPGTGKSTAGLAAALDCLRKPEEVLYLSEARIVQIYRSQTRNNEMEVLDRATVVPTLVIDDMGRHKLDRGTAFLPEWYYDLFDFRCPAFGHRHKTLITSQMDAEQIASWFRDDAIARRFLSLVGMNVIEVRGNDRSVRAWNQTRSWERK